jgi:lipid-A-disaccharide synthase-like uncharacterized protein
MFKIIGAFGLILISVGLLVKGRKKQNILYILGGIGLEVYSISIRDTIFIILQIVFIFSAVYDFIKLSKVK